MNTRDEAEYRVWDLRRDIEWLSANIDRVKVELDSTELMDLAHDLLRAAREARMARHRRAA